MRVPIKPLARPQIAAWRLPMLGIMIPLGMAAGGLAVYQVGSELYARALSQEWGAAAYEQISLVMLVGEGTLLAAPLPMTLLGGAAFVRGVRQTDGRLALAGGSVAVVGLVGTTLSILSLLFRGTGSA